MTRQPLRDLSAGEHAALTPAESNDLKDREVLFIQHGICVAYLSARMKYRCSAGTVLQRCLAAVDQFRNRMTRSLCVYKVGMTSNPIVRFDFYKEANYSHMSLLHCTDNLGVAQMLEAALIASNLSEHGCRNQRYGGEGPPSVEHEPFHFVYVVGGRADQGRAIR